ncbi:hypothetical protein [Vibrio parahaemolyticus]|uniref:hypothetical protein n=1 Tax=Vibrio parahaemolyticus TaxID=670 RepID=UPI002111FDA1|nr:hypothetical protein [Vibrio parahaemolyticus]
MKFTKTLISLAFIFSGSALADETCGDYMYRLNKEDVGGAFQIYASGIKDIGFLDSVEYENEFFNKFTLEEKQKAMVRVYLKCKLSAPSEKLSEVIKSVQ